MEDIEDEYKRVKPALETRSQLIKRKWDPVTANTMAFGLKPEVHYVNPLCQAMEYGSGGAVSLYAIKADYNVPAGEGTRGVQSEMRQMTPTSEFYAPFMEAVCRKAVGWLHAAQKRHAQQKEVPVPDTVDFTNPLYWGRPTNTENGYKAAALKFLEQLHDSAIQSALSAEVTAALQTKEKYRSYLEKRKNTAMDQAELEKLMKDFETKFKIMVYRWGVPSKRDMGRLLTSTQAGQLPTDPKDEPENLKALADKDGRIRPEDKKDTWEMTDEGGQKKIVEARETVKQGASASVMEECEGVRLLLTGLLLLAHDTQADKKVSAERGGGTTMITPTQVYSFLEMMHMCAHLFTGSTNGPKQLYTIRSSVFREMRDMVNKEPYATYDHALREGRHSMWTAMLRLHDTRLLLDYSGSLPQVGGGEEAATKPTDNKKDAKGRAGSDNLTAENAPTALGGSPLGDKVAELKERLDQKNKKIAELEKKLAERNNTIAQKDREIKSLRGQIGRPQAQGAYDRDRDAGYRRARSRSGSPQRDGRRRRG